MRLAKLHRSLVVQGMLAEPAVEVHLPLKRYTHTHTSFEEQLRILALPQIASADITQFSLYNLPLFACNIGQTIVVNRSRSQAMDMLQPWSYWDPRGRTTTPGVETRACPSSAPTRRSRSPSPSQSTIRGTACPARRPSSSNKNGTTQL